MGLSDFPAPVRHSRTPSGFSVRALSRFAQGRARDLPVPAQEVSVRAQGLRPRGARAALAIAIRTVLPSDD